MVRNYKRLGAKWQWELWIVIGNWNTVLLLVRAVLVDILTDLSSSQF
jgi:hypothetical protein